MLKLLAILLLATACQADYLVLKLGSRGISNGNWDWDWQDGQVMEIFPDSDYINPEMTKHFTVIKVNKHYTQAEKDEMLSAVYDEVGNLVRRRNYYLPIMDLPQVKNLSTKNRDTLLKKIYSKTDANGIIDLTAYNIDNYLKDTRVLPNTKSSYDMGGSISSGTHYIGASYVYKTLNQFEGDMATDLIGGTTAIIDGAFDTTAVTWAGIVTSTANCIYITASAGERHAGKWDNTKSSHVVTNGTCHTISGVNYITFDGLQLNVRGNGSDAVFTITASTTQAGITIKNCLITGNGSTGTFNRGFRTNGGGGNKIVNNVIYSFETASCYGINGDSNISGVISYVYNNTVSSCTIGINDSAANPIMVIKNNITDRCPDGYASPAGWGTDSDYNISDVAGDLPVGQTNSLNGTSVLFTDTSGISNIAWDFSLQAGDTAAKGTGVDLSNDPYFPFSTDAINQTRSDWSRGAIDYNGAAPPSTAPAYAPPMILINWD